MLVVDQLPAVCVQYGKFSPPSGKLVPLRWSVLAYLAALALFIIFQFPLGPPVASGPQSPILWPTITKLIPFRYFVPDCQGPGS